jgi:thermostable 8-oxoguanine DNA glycosylase
MGEMPKGLKQHEIQQQVDWTLTDEVKQRAQHYYDLHLITDLNKYTLFQCSMFSVLAARQDYKNHVKTYARLLSHGYGDPAKIVADQKTLHWHRLTSGLSAPNQKRKYLIGLANYFLKSPLPAEIVADATNGQHREFELRDQFAREAPGIADKGSSMLLGHIGYENVVPIDTWMVKFLREHGFPEVKQPNYRTTSGPKHDVYLRLETAITEHAEKNGLTPFRCQVSLWVAATRWTPQKFINPQDFMNTQQHELWMPRTLEDVLPDGKVPPKPFEHFKTDRKIQRAGIEEKVKTVDASASQLLLYSSLD